MNELVLEPGEGAVLALGTTHTVVKADSALSNGGLFVAEHTFAIGFAGPPSHIHQDTDHALYVLDGVARFVVEGQEWTGGAGTFAWVPRGKAHTWGNAGETIVRALEINVPGGFEVYYRELAEAFPAGTPLDADVVREIQRRHGIIPA